MPISALRSVSLVVVFLPIAATSLAGCTASTGRAPPSSREEVRATPAAAAAAAAAPALEALLEPIRKAHGLPALAGAIVTSRGLEALGVTGVRKAGDPTPALADDAFHLGSDTKAITATAIAKVVDLGGLAWTTTIAEVFPDRAGDMNPVYAGVTLETLLAHRGGFPADSWPAGQTLASIANLPGTPRDQREAYVAMALAQVPEAPPGTAYVYSNMGYTVAAAMAERAMNAPWEDLVTRLVFDPLGITTAGFGVMATPGLVDAPWEHDVEGGVTVAIPPGPLADNPIAIGPSGSVHMSVGDWGKFVLEHLRGSEGAGTLVSAASFDKLHVPQFGGDYAGGWITTTRDWAGGTAYTHAGSNTLNFALVWVAPVKDVAVVVMTNRGGDDASAACDEAANALFQQHFTP